jgi:hypothetical protein
MVLGPPDRLTDGINSEGSDEMLRIMLGSNILWLETDSNNATSIVRAGGYRSGAGSKEAGRRMDGDRSEGLRRAEYKTSCNG